MGDIKLQTFIDILKQQADVLAAAAKFSPERIDAVALELLTNTARVVDIIKASSEAERQGLHASREWLLGEIVADALRD
jgi:competence CoiA-like predicted nuclease